MSFIEKSLQSDEVRNLRSSYFDYKLKFSKRSLFILLIATGLINLFLLIPDLTLIENPATRINITIIRVSYSILLFITCYKYRTIVSFKLLSVIISICELIAAGIFLFVFSQYDNPSFLIQTMGLISLVLAIFVIPNRWIYMLLVAICDAIGFFICARVFVSSIDNMEYAAAVSYVGIAVLLCAVSANNTEKHQFMEFLAKRELERISTTDFLTATANRLKMSEAAKKWIDSCKRQESPLSLVFFDVDDLKSINDRYGHSAGDELLAGLAKLIQHQLRNTDVLARWGGDEFIILLPNVSLENAIALAKRIEINVKENLTIEGNQVTCSFGVVDMKRESTFEELVSEADGLMYSAKHKGKDSVEYPR